MRALLLACLLVFGCSQPLPTLGAEGGEATLLVASQRDTDTVVFVAFGADSAITSWPVCPPTSRLNCQFPLPRHSSVRLPLAGKYLNATLAVGAPPGCGTTKAELNLNNPKWFDTVDLSLVDGFNDPMGATVVDKGASKTLGPVLRATGNEKAFGVFPYGCDICTARQSPPCGISPGGPGCKAGTQYKPDVPCQYQGVTKGGGAVVTITVLQEQPS